MNRLVVIVLAAAAANCLAACARQAAPSEVLPVGAPAARLHRHPHPAGTPVPVTIDASQKGAVISRDMIGFEGGGNSSLYESKALAQIPEAFNVSGGNGAIDPVGLAQYEASYIQPNHLDLEIIGGLNNPACTGPATPAQWASDVTYENVTNHFALKRWRIGHFPFASDDPWCGAPPSVFQDPGLYGAMTKAIRSAMRAVDPTVLTGVAIGGPNDNGDSDWDQTVLQTAGYDFVSVNNLGGEAVQCSQPVADPCLLSAIVPNLDGVTATLRSELSAVHHPNEPLYQNEANILTGDSRQISIVGGLAYGLTIAEAMKLGYAGIDSVAIGGGGCRQNVPPPAGDYGWQTFTSDGIIAADNCGPPFVLPGTLFPGARAYQLAARFGHAAQHMLSASAAAPSNVVAYAATQGTGYAIWLFNLDSANPVAVNVQIANAARSSFSATEWYYDKAIYDQSQSGVWAPPISGSLGTVSSTFSTTLTPWSMTVVILK